MTGSTLEDRHSRPLLGQHVVIAGASSGVGRALAHLSAAAGARLTLLARDLNKLRDACPPLANADIQYLDFKKPESIERVVSNTRDINHLAITAGTFRFAPFVGTRVAEWRDVMEERVIGPLTMIQGLAEHIHGSIVLFSGTVARRPLPGSALVAAATAAVESVGRALSLELAPVRVNVVAPGTLDTPMVDLILGSNKARAFADIASRVPARRVGTADDAAHAALFLMTNPYMSAATIEIDGGARLI